MTIVRYPRRQNIDRNIIKLLFKKAKKPNGLWYPQLQFQKKQRAVVLAIIILKFCVVSTFIAQVSTYDYVHISYYNT